MPECVVTDICSDCGFTIIREAAAPCACGLGSQAPPAPISEQLDYMTLVMRIQGKLSAVWEELRRAMQADQRGDVLSRSKRMAEVRRHVRDLTEIVATLKANC